MCLASALWQRLTRAVALVAALCLLLAGADVAISSTQQNQQIQKKKPAPGISKADELFLQGQQLLENGKAQDALPLFTQAIQIDSVHVRSYASRALAYFFLGKADLAMQDCNTGVRINAKDAGSYRVRGLIYAARKTEADQEKAMNDWMTAIRLNPKWGWPYFDKAGMHYAMGEYDKAITDYSMAAQMFTTKKDQATALNSRGYCYFILGKLDKANVDYDQATLLNPSSAIVYANRAGIRFFQKKLDDAIEDCNKAITLEPRTATAYRWRSQVYGIQGKVELAKEDYALAVALDSQQRDAFVYVAFLVNRAEALAALDSFKLGSTVTSALLNKTNTLEKWEPIGEESMAMSSSTKSFLAGEKMRHDALEFEMVAAANLLFRAAKMSPRELEKKRYKIGWLFGPTSTPFDRSRSRDGLGGLRLIGRLDMPDGKQINSIFALTYHRAALNAPDNDEGKVGFLSNADNFRLAVKLYDTGDTKKDFAFQSFAVETAPYPLAGGVKSGGVIKVQPGFYVDSKSGAVTHRDIIWTAHGTNCIQCHGRGSRLDEDQLELMSKELFAKMQGVPKFLSQMDTLGAGKRFVKTVEDMMLATGPVGLLPVNELLAANRENWIKMYPRLAGMAKQDVTGSKWSGKEILNGFGKLTFELKQEGQALMIDAKSEVKGSWTNVDRKVTINFKNCVYQGVVDGPTFYGTGQFTENGQLKGVPWTFALIRQS
jgi:tetratricopeptide (TPR) repeat protein